MSEGEPMIVREWHARATRGGAVVYKAHYHKVIEQRYRTADGFRGAVLMHRPVRNDLVEITVLSYWESMEDIEKLSDSDLTAPVAEPLDGVLLAFDERVVLWNASVSAASAACAVQPPSRDGWLARTRR